MNPAEKAMRAEIARREVELDALRTALAALAGSAAGRGKGNRRPKTAAQRRALSLAMKAAWKRRKAAGKKG